MGGRQIVIRLMHVITGLELGGAEAMLSKLLSQMDRGRFCNSVISLTGRGSLGDSIESSGIPVHALGMRRGSIGPGAIMRFRALLRVSRPAIVQSWMYHADLLALVATGFGSYVPLIWNVRCSDMDMRQYSFTTRAVRRVLALCSSRPAAVIVNSEAGKRIHRQLGYRPRRWELIANGFDVERFRPDAVAGARLRQELGIAGECTLIGMVARVDPMKDHASFLTAACQVAAARPAAHFILVGEGTDRLAGQSRTLAGRLHALGRRLDIERIVSGFDVFCLSSRGEGFSNALGEAMACGVPCVATDVGDAAAILGPCGWCVPPRMPGALAHALIACLDTDIGVRRQIGAQARERIERLYALPMIAARYEALYKELAIQTAVRAERQQ